MTCFINTMALAWCCAIDTRFVFGLRFFFTGLKPRCYSDQI
jgi:hypothetical protein